MIYNGEYILKTKIKELIDLEFTRHEILNEVERQTADASLQEIINIKENKHCRVEE